MTHLTAIILTYNESAHIRDCIESVRFTDRIIVFDSYSTDDTVAIAKTCDAEVMQRKFDNYAGQRNAALEAVKGQTDWVLFVDADERIISEQEGEIREKIEWSDYAGWRVSRHNYIFGVLTKGAGWFPDYQTRLLRVGHAQYDPERQVHEVVILDGAEGTLDHPLIHYNYRNLAHFVSKQQQYVAYDAKILFEQGTRPKFQNFILQPLRQFYWRFVTLAGYQDRWHGLKLSVLMAWYEFQKYRILRNLWHGK
jgi:(heptosyl)LPS beta-1,4-glucosyltransferase